MLFARVSMFEKVRIVSLVNTICVPISFQPLTSEELYDFAREVLKELKKRSRYLDCFLVKAMIPRATVRYHSHSLYFI